MADTYLDLLYRKETELEGMKTGSGWAAWSLAVAKVMFVEYESHHVTLQMLTGNPENKELAPVPITYAGGGRRSFLGAMPCVGDYCVVGWISSNSSGQASAKRPMVLSWFPPPPMLARDWVPAQEFERGEGMDTAGGRRMLKGISDRERFKLRHMEPGNIVASSAQGSDLVLDESVTLVNRRGNEIRLQDQDQALITRSVVTHMAMAGTRIYAGPIQRDANILPTELFADGQDWEHADIQNYLQKLPTPEADGRFGFQGDGHLNPALPFRQDSEGESIFLTCPESSGMVDFGELNPFTFLTMGGFVSTEGQASDVSEDFAYYGGKGFWRYGAKVGSSLTPAEEPHNAASAGLHGFDPEFRVEVAETTDATLPVTEATDNFDADRLPADGGPIPPMVEFVLGSVVGNDFYGNPDLYGKPISPSIVNGEGILSSGVGKPIGDHASMLLKVNPATTTTKTGASWVASRKDGKMVVFIENGLQVFVKGGYSFRTASPLKFESTEKLSVVSEGGEGVSLDAPAGPITITASRPMFGGDAIMSSDGGSEKDQSKDDPALLMTSGGHSQMTAQGSARFSAQEDFTFADAQTFDCRVKSSVQVESGSKLCLSGEAQEYLSTKTAKFTHTGGADEPCRTVEFTASPATGATAYTDVQDKKHILWGSEEVSVDAGDHETNRKLGDENYIIGLGKRTHKSGTNKTVQSGTDGYTNSTLVGGISHKAQLAAMSLMGLTGYSTDTVGKHDASASLFTFTAAANKAAPGSPVTGGSVCPITGLKYEMITMQAYGVNFA